MRSSTKSMHNGHVPFVLATVFISCLMLFPGPGRAQADLYIYDTTVSVSWAANPEPDVHGYEAHRSPVVDGPYAKAHSGFIEHPGVGEQVTWDDNDVVSGGIYYYKLRAVDLCGNMSGFSQPSDAVVVSDGDFDDDGFTDEVEQMLETDPLAAESQPSASVLTLSPEHSLARIGSSSGLSVVGIFEPPGGGTVEYDMTCVVDYHTDPSGIASVEGCGTLTGQEEGTTNVWTWQVVNGQTVAASNVVGVTVDGAPPYVDPVETYPYDSQGMNEDANGNGVLDPGEDLDGDGVLDVDTGPTPRVPVDTGVIIRVVDNYVGENIGVDAGSIFLSVNGSEVPVKVREVIAGDLHEVDIAYRNLDGFTFDEIVDVEVSLSDAAGNPMLYTESFQIESEAEHNWALLRTPAQTVTVLGDGRCEVAITPMPDLINDEPLEGAKIIYECAEPVPPRFGPVQELPELDLSTPVGMPLNLEPANVYDYPVTILAPIKGVELQDLNGDGLPDAGLEAYMSYQYTAEPTALWRNPLDVPGWFVSGSRIDRYGTVPPCVELQVNHSGGLQIGTDIPCPAPRPDIRANGQGGAITVSPDTPVSITVSLDSCGYSGQNAEWWIIADTPEGPRSFLLEEGEWTKGIHTAQSPITDMSSTEIYYDVPPFGRGVYTIYFALDSNADGIFEGTWQDYVEIRALE